MTVTGVTVQPGALLAGLAAMRPRQWVKNVLVLAAPLAAGELFDRDVWPPALIALAAFCAGSSAVYLMNDVLDVKADRLHPRKSRRPVAAGRLSARAAVTLSLVLAVASLALASTARFSLVILLACYLALQAAYISVLKHQAVLDLCVVASGFLLRGVAGGLAAGLPISQWFLLVAGFGSLFIVAGKRYSELHTVGSALGTRRSLSMYTESYLRFIWGIAAGTTMMSYALWAFNEPHGGDVSWHALSIAPFVIAMMRYAVDVDAGRADEPEDIIWRDQVLQLIGLVWLALVCIGVTRG